jgi:protein tyrosine/serine phosphatase
LKTIVCARGGTRHPLRGRWFGKEKAWCKRRNVEFIHMPFSDSQAPPLDCYRRFAEIARDRATHPILVHCEQGIHRSGILSAVYRLEMMNWPLERALRELGQRGFDPDDLKRRTLIDTLKIWHNERSNLPVSES